MKSLLEYLSENGGVFQKQNSYIERFNRTIQDEFFDTYLYDFSDISLINTNLINYLIFYNTQRPHLAIELLTPIDFFISNHFFFNMYGTYAFRLLTLKAERFNSSYLTIRLNNLIY